MDKVSENRLNKLVKAISDGGVTYNGLALARGTWSFHWDERTGVNRLILSCEESESDAISRIAIRDIHSIEVVQQDERHVSYIICCNPECQRGKKHIFTLGL